MITIESCIPPIQTPDFWDSDENVGAQGAKPSQAELLAAGLLAHAHAASARGGADRARAGGGIANLRRS